MKNFNAALQNNISDNLAAINSHQNFFVLIQTIFLTLLLNCTMCQHRKLETLNMGYLKHMPLNVIQKRPEYQQ